MRTSEDSPIPHLGKMILEGEAHFDYPYKIQDVIEVKPFWKTTQEEVKNSNIVLCWRNITRRTLNES
ncbi:MAG: hypothetical protein IJR80_02155, partial [Treponema sp.]|nr:hypothetical protein [Treponema sp.]